MFGSAQYGLVTFVCRSARLLTVVRYRPVSLGSGTYVHPKPALVPLAAHAEVQGHEHGRALFGAVGPPLPIGLG